MEGEERRTDRSNKGAGMDILKKTKVTETETVKQKQTKTTERETYKSTIYRKVTDMHH